MASKQSSVLHVWLGWLSDVQALVEWEERREEQISKAAGRRQILNEMGLGGQAEVNQRDQL